MSTASMQSLLSKDGIPLNGVYDPTSESLVPVAAGAILTDANNNNQKYAAMLAQLATPNASYGHVIIDANTIATYGASITGLVAAASCTDLFTIAGAANKVIRIMRLVVSFTTTAATGATLDLALIKRSALDTGGTSTAPTAVPFDSADAAAAATLAAYTVNPAALGTAVGTLFAQKFQQSLGTATATDFPTNVPLVLQWGMTDSKPIVLRSATEQLALNLGTASTAAGGSFDISIEWTEASA